MFEMMALPKNYSTIRTAYWGGRSDSLQMFRLAKGPKDIHYNMYIYTELFVIISPVKTMTISQENVNIVLLIQYNDLYIDIVLQQ